MITDQQYLIAQESPHSRARCRNCNRMIQQQQLRVATAIQTSKTIPWTHIQCFYLQNKFLDMKNLLPIQVRGFTELSPIYQVTLSERLHQLRTGKIKKPVVSKKNDSKPNNKQLKNQQNYQSGGYNKQQAKLYEELFAKYSNMPVKQLQNILSRNNQTKTGNKSQLAQRVADGFLLGSIPKCKQCMEGRLKFNRFEGSYRCLGYYDGEYQKCGRKYKRVDVQRDIFV